MLFRGCCRNMPDVDALMEEWPPEFEELLKEVGSCILSCHYDGKNISSNPTKIVLSLFNDYDVSPWLALT